MLLGFFLIGLSFVSGIGVNIPERPTPTNTTIYNQTFINQTVNATVNTTQFDNNSPIHIKESWLNSFINSFSYINATNDTLGDSFLVKNLNTATLNMSALDSRYMSGGVRVYWFTNQTNANGNKNMTLTIPNNSLSTITKTLSSGAEVEVASFITQKQTQPVVYVGGMRQIYLDSNLADTNRVVQLQARVFLCENYNELTDTCGKQTSYVNSSTCSDLSTVTNLHELSYNVQNIYTLNTSNRFMVKVYATKTSGGTTNINLYVDDNSYSRIQVPSPVSATDTSNLVPYTGATQDVDLGAYDLTASNITANGLLTVYNPNVAGLLIQAGGPGLPTFRLKQSDYDLLGATAIRSDFQLESDQLYFNGYDDVNSVFIPANWDFSELNINPNTLGNINFYGVVNLVSPEATQATISYVDDGAEVSTNGLFLTDGGNGGIHFNSRGGDYFSNFLNFETYYPRMAFKGDGDGGAFDFFVNDGTFEEPSYTHLWEFGTGSSRDFFIFNAQIPSNSFVVGGVTNFIYNGAAYDGYGGDSGGESLNIQGSAIFGDLFQGFYVKSAYDGSGTAQTVMTNGGYAVTSYEPLGDNTRAFIFGYYPDEFTSLGYDQAYEGFNSGIGITIKNDPVDKRVLIGNGANVTKFENDGTMVFEGEAIVWDDMTMPINQGKVTGSVNVPSFETFKNGTYAYAFVASDQIFATQQMSHSYKLNSTIYQHVHLTPSSTNTGNVTICVEYTKSDINGVFGNTVTSCGVAYMNGTNSKHILDMTGNIGNFSGLSGIINARIYRNATTTGSAYADKVFILAYDLHYQKDTVGSRTESTK